MAIDYHGVFPCKVRESVPDEGLLQMQKARSRALAALEAARSDPSLSAQPPESIAIKVVVLRPDGPEEVTTTAAELLQQAAQLTELAIHCGDCPANVRKTDFGCGGAIHYPLSEKGERWLLSRLPANMKSPAGQMLRKAIENFQFDGAPIRKLRGNPQFCASSVPQVRRWGRFFAGKFHVTSDQILHMAFGVGSLQSMHAKLLAYFLGYLDDRFELSGDSADLVRPEDDQTTLEFKFFLAVAALAGTSDIPVHIDA